MFHHLGITTELAKKEFKNVRYVLVCGTNERALDIAKAFRNELCEIGRSRFVVIKVLNVIVCSHGMGGPSISICLNELIRALQLANNCRNVTFIRVGTSGGIGVPPGTIICTTDALNEDLEPVYETNIMGTIIRHPAILEPVQLGEEMILGKTLSANCFYENQARTDGAFCSFRESDKIAYLNHLHSIGVRNIEMEVVPFAAIVHRAGLRAIACCITLVDRLSDQVPSHDIDIQKLVDKVVNIVYYLSMDSMKKVAMDTELVHRLLI
jgi:uridine phosphorylase